MSASFFRFAPLAALVAAETRCDVSEIVAVQGSALFQRSNTTKSFEVPLEEDDLEFLQESNIHEISADRNKGSTITVDGTFWFGLDGKNNKEFQYVRETTGKGGSKITGNHQGTDGKADSIVFDTDGTGIVGKMYKSTCASGVTVNWKAQSVGSSQQDGNFRLTIIKQTPKAKCFVAAGGIAGSFASNGNYKGKPLFCKDDGSVVIRYGSTDSGWDWCGASNCEVRGHCGGSKGRWGYSADKNGFPATGNVFRWGAAKTTLSDSDCTGSPAPAPLPTPAPTPPTPTPAPSPSPSPTPGGEGDSDQWLSKTNAKRSDHGACPVTWNDVLAADMLAYLKTLKSMKHDKVYKLKPPHGPCGENLAWASNGASVDMAITGWYNEVNDCANPIPKDGCQQPKPDKMVGHFTSMVWKGAREMGCAVYNNFAGCRYMEKNAKRLTAQTPNMGGYYVKNVGEKGAKPSGC